MKTNLIRVVVTLCTLFAAVAVFAQSSYMRITVPFEFIAAGQTMPAGDYSVEESMQSGLVILRSLDFKQTAFVMSAPGSNHETDPPSLRFERHDGQAYLIRVNTTTGLARVIVNR